MRDSVSGNTVHFTIITINHTKEPSYLQEPTKPDRLRYDCNLLIETNTNYFLSCEVTKSRTWEIQIECLHYSKNSKLLKNFAKILQKHSSRVLIIRWSWIDLCGFMLLMVQYLVVSCYPTNLNYCHRRKKLSQNQTNQNRANSLNFCKRSLLILRT